MIKPILAYGIAIITAITLNIYIYRGVHNENTKNTQQGVYETTCSNVCTPFKAVESYENYCMCNQSIIRRDYGVTGRMMSLKERNIVYNIKQGK